MTKELKTTDYMGYAWEEVSPAGKRLAKKIAGDLNITKVEAYQLLMEHLSTLCRKGNEKLETGHESHD